MFFLPDDLLSELSDLELYFLEITTAEEKKNCDLFIYLVNRGYKEEASELWDKVITSNYIVKAL